MRIPIKATAREPIKQAGYISATSAIQCLLTCEPQPVHTFGSQVRPQERVRVNTASAGRLGQMGSLDERLADFKEERKELEAKLEVLESRTEDAWQDIKDGIELAWDGLKTGLLAARSEFEDKDK